MASCQILSNAPKFIGFRKEYVNQNATSDSNNTGSFVIGICEQGASSDSQLMYGTKVPVVYEFVCEGSWFTITQNLEVSTNSNTTKYTDLLPYTKKNAGSDNYFTTAKIRTTLTPTGPSQMKFLTLDYELVLAGQSGYLQLRSVTIGGTPLTGIADFIYPVGSIYMSVNNTSPATLFGGTWEQLKDRFLLGAGDTYTAGATDGEATHTLSIEEMPDHWHKLPLPYSGSDSYNPATAQVDKSLTAAGNYVTTGTASEGGSQPHNNMPPYLAVYMWKRTA